MFVDLKLLMYASYIKFKYPRKGYFIFNPDCYNYLKLFLL